MHVEPDRLYFLQPDEWDKEQEYNVDPPICIRYTIVWKVKFNNRTVLKDTEQDLVLAPTSYWTLFLQPKLDALLSKKQTAHKRMKADDSNIIVSVNQRSEQNLERRFDETSVDWSAVEKRLLHWGELLRSGKKLGVEVSFNYVEAQTPVPSASRGGSTTQRMLTERAAQIEAAKAEAAE